MHAKNRTTMSHGAKVWGKKPRSDGASRALVRRVSNSAVLARTEWPVRVVIASAVVLHVSVPPPNAMEARLVNVHHRIFR